MGAQENKSPASEHGSLRGKNKKMPKHHKKNTGLIIAIAALAVFGYSMQQAVSSVSVQTMKRMSASSVNITDDGSATYALPAPVDPEPEPVKPDPVEPDPIEPEPDSDTTDPVYEPKTQTDETDDGSTTSSTDTDPVYVPPADDSNTSTDDSASTDANEDEKTDSDFSDWAATSIYNPETVTTQPTTKDTTTTEPMREPKEDFVDVNDPAHKTKTEDYIKTFVPRTEAVEIFRKEESQLTEQERKRKSIIKQEAVKDTDGDGIPDHEEYRIGTSIFSADSDNDGFKDGDEIKKGFNPLIKSDGNQNDKVRYQDPETVKEKSAVYKVEKVEMKETGSVSDAELFQLAGKALPGSVVTLYVYSDPIVVTVVADGDGNWSYVLNKELEDGEHKVYAAVTDSTGKVTERSEGFAFVKTAQALTPVGQEASQVPEQSVSPVKEAQSNMTKIWLAIAGVSILLALFSIGYFVKNHKAKEHEEKDGSKQTPSSEKDKQIESGEGAVSKKEEVVQETKETQKESKK